MHCPTNKNQHYNTVQVPTETVKCICVYVNVVCYGFSRFVGHR